MHELNSVYLGRRAAGEAPPVLNQRYLLLALLGRGGFSEVYRALDLFQLRTVACKIHTVDTDWPAARQAAYVRMATREYNIHRHMLHPRIVPLRDVFEVCSIWGCACACGGVVCARERARDSERERDRERQRQRQRQREREREKRKCVGE